ncbi:MAG: hypothetical protein JWQ23_2018 [Herminiimonas sp.]|jgi:hypothetical protein|nr:hypothetical protein [Herminiimonas sp.]
MSSIRKTIAIAAIFGMTLYALVYFMAIRSDAFKFIVQEIGNSQTIRTQVGDIKKIRPSFLGVFDRKTADSDEWVSMMVDVSGQKTTLELQVKAKKENGAWLLQSVKSGDQKLDLN